VRPFTLNTKAPTARACRNSGSKDIELQNRTDATYAGTGFAYISTGADPMPITPSRDGAGNCSAALPPGTKICLPAFTASLIGVIFGGAFAS
jgi:hypothetical protein